ncbi:uncharacterized protein MELLADRAFT_32759, partial [Melampsora larici-populina 98AG31]
QRPDYALSSGGAQIYYWMTSPTYKEKPATKLARLFNWLVGGPVKIEFHPPSVALDPDTNVGRCWAMEGQRGSLGIFLAQKIIIDELVIEHTDPSMAFELESILQKFELFGLSEMLTSPVKLGEGVFNISSAHIQHFSIQPQIPVVIVIFNVLSNHGDPDFTCIYKLRIHGQMV